MHYKPYHNIAKINFSQGKVKIGQSMDRSQLDKIVRSKSQSIKSNVLHDTS